MRARRPRRAVLRAAAALTLAWSVLAGCTNLFHSDAKPEQTYVLRAPSAAPPAEAAAPAAAASPLPQLAAIQVAHPAAAPGLDGPHIILVQADHRMNFYLGSRWPVPLPDLIESLAVETLRASGEWQSVQDSGSPFPSQYLLEVSVRRFEADYTAGKSAPHVAVVLDCTLGARQGRDLVASFVAQGSAPAAGERMSEVVAAFESASSAAFTSLAQQTAAATRAFAERSATTH